MDELVGMWNIVLSGILLQRIGNLVSKLNLLCAIYVSMSYALGHLYLTEAFLVGTPTDRSIREVGSLASSRDLVPSIWVQFPVEPLDLVVKLLSPSYVGTCVL